MNEVLIERLFIEAQKQITSKTTKDFANKFTELIVRECASYMNEFADNGDIRNGDDLLKHFGVEE